MELTEVSIHSWLAVIGVVILNYIRILVYDNGLHDCVGDGDDHYDDHHDDHHRNLEGDDAAEFHLTAECADFGSRYFLFCGMLLILFGFAVCFANYWSERKVAITGKYWTEEQQVSVLKTRLNDEQGRCVSGSGRALVEISEEVWHVCSLRKVLEEKKIEEYHRHISQERRMKECIKGFTSCWSAKAASRVQTVEAIKDLKNANKSKLRRQDSQASLKTKVSRAGAVGDEKDQHPLLFEYDDPMFFKNRKAHKFLTECFQMLMALYIGMWATNYLFVSQHSTSFALYLVLTLIQVLIMLIQMSFLQDTACSLLAVTSLLNEAAEVMCEEDHIKAKLLPVIRKEIEELTPEGMSQSDHLLDVYKFVNFDGDDNGIGFKEFSSLLFTVDLILPDEEVDILFRAVDSNGSGNIEFEELLELFVPNSRLVSKKVEDGSSERMKLLSHQTSMATGGLSQTASPQLAALKGAKISPHSVVPMANVNSDGFVDIESAGRTDSDNAVEKFIENDSSRKLK
jgi:hypothetical protein